MIASVNDTIFIQTIKRWPRCIDERKLRPLMSYLDLLLRLHPYAYPVIGLSLILLYFIAAQWFSLLRRLPYPPGPPERFLTRNTGNMPHSKACVAFTEWGKKYGGISHFRIFNKHTIILNTQEDCANLLEKRSNIYSDRPSSAMLDLMGWTTFNAGFMHYNSRWRSHRRIFQQYFRPNASLNYRPIQTRKVNDLLYSLLTTPEDFMEHCRTLPAAVIMAITYDHDVSPKDDHFVNLADAANQRLSASVFPGASLLNAIPILRFTPSWFPGARFKRFGSESRKMVYEMRDVPLASVEDKMKEGKAPNCILAELLQGHKSQEEYEAAAGVAATAYAAGADTTVSTLGTFFYSMGSERLANFDDRASMPYIEAMHREVLRWRPVLPLGLPHAATSSDIYNGFYIPKGATVIGNIWAITHDPVKYPEPDVFNPDRFFRENGELNDDKVDAVFGFGRRICPGQHLASATLWLAIATILQNFDISKKVDSSGKEIPISGEYTDGMISHPLPFECSITPRTSMANKIISDAVKS
ncbi:cytochrome P450 [Pholiota conissans]|uniref:Cytochrome P450 n=1 Tax=Pholiota conissans TaxID=109636 RepID=A0A9P5YP47_9AGAR|nr:cytochrome P450 [Pholiota conissans]